MGSGGHSDKSDKAAAIYAASNERIAKEGIKFMKEELAFQKKQYQDWYSTYGDLQKNLGNYYKNLSAEAEVSKNLQALGMEYSQASKDVQRQLAQAGIQGGGAEAATRTTMAAMQATQRAGIRANANEMVAQKQAGFLGIGLSQGTAMLGIQGQMAGATGNIYGQSAQGMTQIGSSLVGAHGSMGSAHISGMYQAVGAVGGGFAKGLGMAMSDRRLKDNLKLESEIAGIKFYSFTWNSKAEQLGYKGKSFGVIAQEVQDVLPDAVIDNGHNYLMVDYSKIMSYIGGN